MYTIYIYIYIVGISILFCLYTLINRDYDHHQCPGNTPLRPAISWGGIEGGPLKQGSLYYHTTVDGRNPAPIDAVNIPLFAGFHTCQVVQDFFHQQYCNGNPSKSTYTWWPTIHIPSPLANSCRFKTMYVTFQYTHWLTGSLDRLMKSSLKNGVGFHPPISKQSTKVLVTAHLWHIFNFNSGSRLDSITKASQSCFINGLLGWICRRLFGTW